MLVQVKIISYLLGVKLSSNGSLIPHLMFVDDIIMYLRANVYEALALRERIEVYKKWSV